jgi:protoporphyrinogen oxidase
MTLAPESHVGIVGGGTLGLTLALRLAQAGHRVEVFESDKQPGGLATWLDYGPFVWDQYYHVITARDAEVVGLIEELDLGDQLVWRSTKMGFLHRNRLVSMSNYLEFLTFPALGLWQKLRLGLGILRTVLLRNESRFQGVTAREFLADVFGQAVWERMWRPLVESKFGALADRIPASIMVATIQRVYGTRSRTDGSEQLGYLRGGYRSFFTRLVERIEEAGGVVHLGARVESIRGEAGSASLYTADGERRFDHVVSTVPNPLFRRLALELDDLEGGTSGEPAFLGVVCLNLVLRRSLSDFYVTNLIETELPFTGIVEYTALADSEQDFGGYHLVYLPRYEVPDSEWFDKSDEEILEGGMRGLEAVWPDVRERVVASFVNRARRVQAIWLPGTRERVEPLRSRTTPVESITAELVGLDTLNNNAILRLANTQARRLLGQG